jgi:23S rRNA pseudouridine1911/1915/1917 synthase
MKSENKKSKIENQKSKIRLVVKHLAQPTRLDRVLRDHFPRWGRRAVQSLINAGGVKVNRRQLSLCSWKVKNGDKVEILRPPPDKKTQPTVFNDEWLIAQEGDLLVLNKPAGLLSHATRWAQRSNLLDLAIERFGPVTLFNRLDRDTSGVILLTHKGPINAYLDDAFKKRTIKKEYLALVSAHNRLSSQGEIKAYLDQHSKRRDMMQVVERGGKWALTGYEIIGQAAGKQLLRLWPKTGRTHQLRVHLAYMGAPILGDRLYGKERSAKRLMLHASQITLPASEGFMAQLYSAPVPAYFYEQLPKSLIASIK